MARTGPQGYPFDDDPPPRNLWLCGDLRGVTEAMRPVHTFRAGRAGKPSGALTPGQLRRYRRNLAIAAAARGGCSQRLLSEVFALPRSRIGEIIAELASAYRTDNPKD